jgi:hypothetical protein
VLLGNKIVDPKRLDEPLNCDDSQIKWQNLSPISNSGISSKHKFSIKNAKLFKAVII